MLNVTRPTNHHLARSGYLPELHYFTWCLLFYFKHGSLKTITDNINVCLGNWKWRKTKVKQGHRIQSVHKSIVFCMPAMNNWNLENFWKYAFIIATNKMLRDNLTKYVWNPNAPNCLKSKAWIKGELYCVHRLRDSILLRCYSPQFNYRFFTVKMPASIFIGNTELNSNFKWKRN